MIRTMKGALAASAAFYAAHGAALAKPAVDLSSSEQAAMQACSSGKPFVVVDSFKITKTIYGDQGTPDSASMDFNGDLHVQGREFIGLDGTHGDLVAGITGANGRHVIPFQTVDIMPDDLAHAFTSLADALESGEIEKPGAVIASLVLPTAVEHMASLMPYKGPGQEVTLDTLAQRKDKIIRFLFKKAEDRNDPYRAYYQAYIRIYEAFKRIDALGIPVFLAAGNEGPAPLFNMMVVFPGAHAVGALDRAGRKTAYTNDSSLVQLWRKGSFTLRQVEGGIDLNGDDRPEFTDDQLSKGPAVAERYNGKPVSEAAGPVPTMVKRMAPMMRTRGVAAFKNVLPEGVYPTDDLMDLYGLGGTGSADFMKELGPWMHHPSLLVFKETPEGFLAFDPEGNGDPAQRISWDATSYAAPNICGD